MSAVVIRSLLEAALAAMTPALATAWENVPFTPVTGAAYQRAHLLLSEPDSIEMSGGHYREQGFLQVTLCYPLNAGAVPAAQRAELIRDTFYRGKTLNGSGISLIVEEHPEIMPGVVEEDRYVLPVRVRFFANITRS